MKNEHVVYILKDIDDRRYIGLTSDLKKRLEQHNEGFSKYTKRGKSWKVFWHSISMNLGDARRLENKMKRQKGGAGLSVLSEKYKGS